MESILTKEINRWNNNQTLIQPLAIYNGSQLYQNMKLINGIYQWVENQSYQWPAIILQTRSISNSVGIGLTTYNLDIWYLELTNTDFSNVKSSQDNGWNLIMSMAKWFDQYSCNLSFINNIDFIPVEPNNSFQNLVGVGAIASIQAENTIECCF